MRVVAESSWSWMLFEDEDRRVLTVLCNFSAYYFEIAIELNPHENAGYLSEGHSFVDMLAVGIQHSPQAYQSRHLSEFHTDERARAATAQWRSSHA